MNRIDKKNIALWTALIAGIFTVIVSVLMAINFWQLKSTDPLESESLKILVEQLQKDTSNQELQEEIRRLDLLVRKAYFTKHWQIRAGGALLLGGGIVLLIALRVFHGLKSSIDVPAAGNLAGEAEILVSRRWLLFTVLILFVFSLFAAYLSEDYLAGTPVVGEVIKDPGPPVQEIVPKSSETSQNIVIAEREANAAVGSFEEINPTDKPGEIEKKAEPPARAEEVKPAESHPTHADIMRQFPSFRGPYGIGLSQHKNIPVDWDGASGKNILWKSPIPAPGYNSPVIWGDRLFLTGASRTSQSVYCYDRNNGKILWQHDANGIPRTSTQVPRVTDDTGFAAPSAATDGHGVFAIFATGDVVGMDMEGNRLWGRNLGLPDNHYGHSSSLLVWRQFLFIQFDGNKGGKVMGLDIANGTTIWETQRNSKISWASPILANVGNKYELILTSTPLVAGYDPLTGKEKWSVDCLSGEVGPSAGYSNGVVFAANEYANLVAISPGPEAKVLWESNEYLPEVSSPVAAKGMLFIGTSYGVIACFDASSGELIWEYEADEGFYASPIIADDKVYFLDMDGKMHIFSVDRKMNLIGEPELGEGSVCTPAFCDGRIYLRSREFLYCIGEK